MAELTPPPANPYVMLEQLQLTEDLVVVCGSVYTRAGARLVAEQLYARGVRSRLHAPRATEERVHFTSDPETGFFTLHEPGVYELIMELDQPDVELRPLDQAPVRPSQVSFYRLVLRERLEQMSEVPGHVQPRILESCGRCAAEGQGDAVPAVGKSPRGRPRCALCLYNDGHQDAMEGWSGQVGGHVQLLARTRMREFVGAEILVREDPDWGRASEIAKIRWDGVSAYVVLRPEVSLVTHWTKCQRCRDVGGMCRYHARRPIEAAPGVPNPIPERPLPKGVQHVIQFVQLLDFGAAGAGNRNWAARIADGRGGGRTIDRADLHAVLAEIPDVAPRYPTIWAYEQACRTIRERDARIERALGILASAPIETQEQVGDLINAVVQALRLRMPRTVPATEEEKSDVARALEAAATENDADVGHWPTVARVLAAEVEHLRTLGDAMAAEVPEPKSRCPRCEHLVERHAEDGSGCMFTVSDVHMGLSANCPCTFNPRSEQQEANGG